MTTNPAFLEICAEVRGGVQEIPICVSKSRIIRSSERENNFLTRNIQSTGRGPGKSHKKSPQKAPGRPKPKSGQFNQQLTHIGKPASQRASQAHDRLVLYTLGLSGDAWEAWGGLGRIGECFGEAWGGLGSAWECFGEDWGGRRTAHNARSTSPA